MDPSGLPWCSILHSDDEDNTTATSQGLMMCSSQLIVCILCLSSWLVNIWHICIGYSLIFSAFTLLVGHQEEHLACKYWVMRCWHGYLSGARCKWFACDPANATATPSSLASSRLVWHLWCQLTEVVAEKRPLNGCLILVTGVGELV